jgi:hypothetical protein
MPRPTGLFRMVGRAGVEGLRTLMEQGVVERRKKLSEAKYGTVERATKTRHAKEKRQKAIKSMFSVRTEKGRSDLTKQKLKLLKERGYI